MKSRTAVPSARNSGFETYPISPSPRSSRPWRIFSPVPTGTVDFITRIARPSSSGRSSTTLQTRERSASPDCVGGVSTHTKRNRQLGEVGRVEREAEPVAVALEQLGHVGLVERHLAGAERRDLLGHDVANDDVVAEVGEADPRDEADPAGAEDAHRSHRAGLYLACRSGLRPVAIASIVSFESESSSVFTTQ